MDTFIVIQWPDIEALMEMPDFNDNAYLINDEPFLTNYGSSAYFINEEWFNHLHLTGEYNE